MSRYIIQKSSKGPDGWSAWSTLESYSPATTSQTIRGLTNDVEYRFRVAAENSSGRGDFSVASASVTPRAFFVIQKADGTPFDSIERGGETFSVGAGTIYVGRNDGISRMLRIDGSVEFSDSQLTANGVVYRMIGPTAGRETPLFNGTFAIDLVDGRSTQFSEAGAGAVNQYKPGGLDVDFSGVTINATSLGFEATVRLPQEFGLPGSFVLDLKGANALTFTQDDTRLGTSGKVPLPVFNDILLLGFLPIKDFQAFMIEYVAAQDLFKLQGKLGLEFDAKFPSTRNEDDETDDEEEDSGTTLTADLSGDNFLQIQGGKVDVKGELSMEGLQLAEDWELDDVKLTIDTLARDLNGTATLKFPFAKDVAEVVGTIDIKLPPPSLALNGLSIRVDGLTVPVPIPAIPGLKLTGFRGSLDNMAASDPDPLEFGGGISLEQGPKVVVGPWKIPGLGIELGGGEFQTLTVDLDGKVNKERAEGTFTATLLHEKILRSTGEATIRWADPGYMEFKGQTSVLDGWIKASNSYKIDSSLNVSMTDVVDVSIPAFVPVIGGDRVGTSVFELQYRHDGTLSNDYVAVWRTVRVQQLGMDLSFPLGVKVAFDGKVELYGSRTIPVTGSWDLTAGTEWVLLAADWKNPRTDVALRVKKPDGTWIDEADFAAHDIAIVDEFGDANTKVVILKRPSAGRWDLAVANPTGLGDVKYTALKQAAQPEISFPAVPAIPTAPKGSDLTFAYACFDPDSTASVRFFYDTDRSGFDGVPIGGGFFPASAAGTFTWSTGAVPEGEYAVYAMVTDGETPPVYRYMPGTVRITGDFSLTPAFVEENSPAGTVVGALSLPAPAYGAFAYSLVDGVGSAGNSLFAIVGNQLQTARVTDFETQESHSIRIRATDATGWFFEKAFAVKVTDADDCEVFENEDDESITFDVGAGWFEGNRQLLKRGAGTLSLDVASSHTRGTVVEAGEVVVRNPGALGTGSVVVKPGARMVLDVATQGVSVAGLDLRAGGRLDVGTSRIVMAPGTFDLAAIRGLLAVGHGAGAAAESSGITSAAAAAVPGRAVGHAVDGNGNLVVGFAAAGDLDMNGIVDGNDANALINSRLFDSGLPATWAEGDYDYNGVLDMDDVIAFVTGGMYDQGPYLPSTSGPTAQAQTASNTQADTIGKVTFEAGDVAISAAFSPVDSSNDEGMSGISTPSRNDPLMDAAFAMLSSQEQSSTNSAERKKVAFLIL